MLRPLFLRKLRKYVAALPALAFGFVANPAFSTIVTIDAGGVTTGASTASFVGGSLTTTGGTFTKSTTAGQQPSSVIGVKGGFLANEVDVSGEKLSLNFGSNAVIVSEITLGLLKRKGVDGNANDEAAQLVTNGGTSCASGAIGFCILSAAGSGVWRGKPDGVDNLSPANTGNGGIFKITNPFGTELISSIQFLPWAISGTGAANSDFGLVSITYTTTAIPEPGTLALVSLGLLGLSFAGGRRARR